LNCSQKDTKKIKGHEYILCVDCGKEVDREKAIDGHCFRCAKEYKEKYRKEICKACYKEFYISKSEYGFYISKRLNLPKTCPDCRGKKDGGTASHTNACDYGLTNFTLQKGLSPRTYNQKNVSAAQSNTQSYSRQNTATQKRSPPQKTSGRNGRGCLVSLILVAAIVCAAFVVCTNQSLHNTLLDQISAASDAIAQLWSENKNK
jgi:hypothetical protein